MWTWPPHGMACVVCPIVRPYFSSLWPAGMSRIAHLVSERHVVDDRQAAVLLAFQRDDADFLACVEVAHRYADIVDESRGSRSRVT